MTKRASPRPDTGPNHFTALLAVTRALSGATDERGVALAALSAALPALGAFAGTVLRLTEGGAALEVLHQTGYDEERVRTWHHFPLSTGFPATDAVRLGQPVFVGAGELSGQYPALQAAKAESTRAVAALPLSVGGQTFGALTLSYDTDWSWTPPEREFAVALAGQLAQALERARLFQEERRARERATRLYEVTAALVGAGDEDGVLGVLFGRAFAAVGATSGGLVTGDGGGFELVTGVNLPASPPGRRRVPGDFRSAGVDAARTSRALYFPDLEAFAAAYPEHAESTREGGVRAVAALPFSAGGQPGAVFLAFPAPQVFDAEARTFLETLAGQVGQALERVRLSGAQERAREVLERQAALLDQTHDAVLAWELGGTVTFWNRGAERLYGFSRDEALGRVVHELLGTNGGELDVSALERALRARGEWQGTLRHRARDGRGVVVHSRHVLVPGRGGERGLVLETNRDITAQERAAAYAAHLQEVTARLTAVIAREEVVRVVLERGRAASGASAGAVCELDEAARTLTVLGSVGPDLVARRCSVESPVPPAVAARTGEASFLGEVAPGAAWPAGARALVNLPLRAGARTLGVLSFGFDQGRDFPGDERAFLLALGDACAVALERARLFEDERLSRERATVLADAGELLAGGGDPQDVLDRFARLVVPRLGDWCNVVLPDGKGGLVSRALAHRDPAKVELLRGFRARLPLRVEDDSPVARVFRTGEPLLMPEVEDPAAAMPQEAADPAFVAAAEAANARSALVVPLVARGETQGVLSLISHTPGRFGSADLAFAGELARRAALALDNARLSSEREAALADVRREQQRLAAVLDQLPVAVWLAELPTGRLIGGNAAISTLMRQGFLAASDVAGYGAYEGYHPDGRRVQAHEWPLARTLATGESVEDEEIEVVRGDGTRGTLSFTSAVIRDAGGGALLAVVVGQDVTLRRRAERQLRAWSAELERQVASRTEELQSEREALAAFADFLEAVGGEAELRDLARRACEVLHAAFGDGSAVYYEPREGTWPGVTWAGELPGETLAVVRQGLPGDLVGRVASGTGEAVFVDGWRDDASDTARQTREYGTAAFSPVVVGGEVVGLLTAGLRARERWSAREQAVFRGVGRGLNLAAERAAHVRVLREQERQLRAANEELGAFAYTVSHDLRAPVRHVGSFAGLLRRKIGDDPGLLRYVDQIEGAAKRMETLTDALLGLARTGAATLTKTDVDLRLLVEAARSDLTPELGGRRVTWRFGELPAVRADAGLLRQVFANLLGNAVKYSRGREEAVVEVWAEGTPDEVTVAVRDNGAGFDPRYASKLFGVFQRLHHGHEFEGTGVGLANVKRVVEKHGGRVWAQGRPGEGATFFFSLPRGEAGSGG